MCDMNFRTIAFIALVLALLSIGIYWFINRPTPEERAMVNFFAEFKKSHYEEAEDYTLGSDFWRMAADTSVRDTNGQTYTIGEYFPESRKAILQFSVETYVKPHIAKWKYLSMDTTRLTDTDSAVHFRIELSIRDFTGGNMLGVVDEGLMEGTAYMEKENDDWKVERFDLTFFSDGGLELAPYLERAQ